MAATATATTTLLASVVAGAIKRLRRVRGYINGLWPQPQQVQHEATAKANLLLGTSTGLQVLVLFKQGKTQETGYLKMQMLQLCKLTMKQVLLLQRKGVERINPFAFVA